MTEELLRKDPNNANAHRLAARLYSFLGRNGEALTHSERALALNPYDGDVLVIHAVALMLVGRANEAVEWVEKALRYNPQPPAYYRQSLMAAQFWAGDDAAALRSLRRVEGCLLPQLRHVAIAVLWVNGCRQDAAAARTGHRAGPGVRQGARRAQLGAVSRLAEQVDAAGRAGP